MTLLGVRNDSGGVLCGTIVLVGVMRHGSWAAISMVPGTWPVSCADWRPFVLVARVSCLLCSLAVQGVCGFLRVTQIQCTRQCYTE